MDREQMTLEQAQANLRLKGYTSEEVDVWTAGFNYAAMQFVNVSKVSKEQAAEIERLRAAFSKFLNEVDEHNASFYGQGVARIFTIEARAALGGSDE